MVDYPLIKIEDLPPVVAPTRTHSVAAMLDGSGGKLLVEEILSLAEAGDINGLDAALVELLADAIVAAAAKAALADTDVLPGVDGVTHEQINFTLTNLIASIFKTTRTIANGRFASASFGLVNAGGKVLSDDTTALTADRTRTWPDKNVNIGNAAKFAILQDQKASGTNGGSTVAAAWTTMVLNTKVLDADNIVSLSGNAFTPAIDCVLRAARNFVNTGAARMRLFNVTDNVEVVRGLGSNSGTSSNLILASTLTAKLLAAKTYRLEYWASSAQASNGLGSAVSDGGTEVFLNVDMQGLAA